MIKIIYKYILSFIFISIIGIIILDLFILPSYVGYRSEYYLPDLRGEHYENASYKLNQLGFKVEIIKVPYEKDIKPSTIIKMHPRAFTKVKQGRTIKLTISGKEENYIMPDLSNYSLRNAKIAISRFNIKIDTIIYEYDNNIKPNYITYQVPKAGKNINNNSKIIICVSKGIPPDFYILPNLLNMGLDRAKKNIVNAGLRLGLIDYEFNSNLLNKTVIRQSMTPGMRVSFPVTIDLIISKDKEGKWE